MMSRVLWTTLLDSSILRVPMVLAMLYSVQGGEAQTKSKWFGGKVFW
jgi:hypothetical protein